MIDVDILYVIMIYDAWNMYITLMSILHVRRYLLYIYLKIS